MAAIVLAAVATFARAVPYPLQLDWDDRRFLVDDPDVHDVSLRSFVNIVTQVRFEAYHPLHLLSYWLDVPWAGANGPVLHGVSLALYCVALCVLFWFLRGLGLGRAGAVLAVLLCGLHPVQVEAVSWATGRKDVLALLFGAASLGLHVRSRSMFDRAAWGSLACFALAALSKTTTLPLPVAALLIDVIARDVRPVEALKRQASKLALAVPLAFMVVTTWQTSEMLRATAGGASAAPLRAAVTLTHQLGTAIWPSALSPMYPTQTIANPTWSGLVGPGLVAAAAFALFRMRARLALAGLCTFVVLMLPILNLVPMYFPLQDRYLSLPLVGLALAVSALVDQRGGPLSRAFVVVCVAALALRTVQYQGAWSSSLRLWGHAASTQPDAEYAWLKLGEVRRDAGQLEGAIHAYQRMIAVAPTRKLAWAALFEAVALRDERIFGMHPSHARTLAQRYYELLDHAPELRDFAGLLLAGRYLRALELPMSQALLLSAMPDNLLERAARTQLRDGRPSLARLYLRHMREPSLAPELAAVRKARQFEVLPSFALGGAAGPRVAAP